MICQKYNQKFSNEEIMWLKNHPEFENGKIKYEKPIEFQIINHIMAGRKKYTNIEDFLQDYHAERYNISYYQKEYKNILNKIEPYIYKYIDDKNFVLRYIEKNLLF